ncbi:hypothetical protein ElyMa_006422100 [Elysia marginata]|uniref:Uncharacterized protein n=1 Tax=Elysia marginata TaxID=1093978 RepID=A0AAV4HWQ3_9GAST|nr:hypothetical protein ElyMa_006422100 [Elysia marginata]
MTEPAPLGWSCDQDVSGMPPKAQFVRSPFLRRSEEKIQKDMLKASKKDFNIDPTLWEALAQNRPAWRGAVAKGAKTYEQQREQAVKTKQAVRKAQANCNPTPQTTTASWTCPPRQQKL